MSLEKALARLPKELEEREVETRVQMELLKTLTSMRYNPPPTKHAQRPKKSQKLPPGASYTCKVQEKPNKIVEEEEEAEESSSSSCNSEDEEEGDPRRKSLRTKQKGKSVPAKKKGKAPLSKKSQQLPARKKNQETDEEEEEEEVMVSSSNSNSNSEGEEDEEPKKKPSKKKGKAPLFQEKGPVVACGKVPACKEVVAFYQPQ